MLGGAWIFVSALFQHRPALHLHSYNLSGGPQYTTSVILVT